MKVNIKYLDGIFKRCFSHNPAVLFSLFHRAIWWALYTLLPFITLEYFYQCIITSWGLRDSYECIKPIYFKMDDINPKGRFVNLFLQFQPFLHRTLSFQKHFHLVFNVKKHVCHYEINSFSALATPDNKHVNRERCCHGRFRVLPDKHD